MTSPQRFGLAGLIALALLVAGCSSSSGGTDWSAVTALSAGSGMAELVAAAKKEGTLNVIALTPARANYGSILKAFAQRYAITVVSQNPAGSSQGEINAVRSESGTSNAPDVLDVEMAVAPVSTSLFAPYKVSTWGSIPASQKDSGGLWTQDYGGYMSVGYDSARFGTITSMSQLLGPRFKNAVALSGDPTAASAALNGVMMANLAAGGTPDSIARGVGFFRKLNQAGNFVPVQASRATIRAGTTPAVINWDYLNTAGVVGQGANWKVFVPSSAVLGGYHAQAISKTAPHPAAARLWEEFLYGQGTGEGQKLWLHGGAGPVEMAAIDSSAARARPPVSGSPVFLTAKQAADAAAYLSAHWARAVKSKG